MKRKKERKKKERKEKKMKMKMKKKKEKKKKMKRRILVVNDDGIESKGVAILVEAMATKAEMDIRISCPETNQSGVSHKVTLRGEIEVRKSKRVEFGGRWAIGVGGTPVDAVRVGMHLCGKTWKPEIVVTGVNEGNNLGECSIYSGTVAAAVEAVAVYGIPGIAMSYDIRSYEEFTRDEERERER